MIKSKMLIKILFAVLFLLFINTVNAQNDCVVDVPEATAPLLPGSAISSMGLSDETISFDGNLNGKVVFSSVNSLYRSDKNSLQFDLANDRYTASNTIAGVSSILKNDSSELSVLITQINGILLKINIDSNPLLEAALWPANLRRSSCAFDSIHTATIFQARDFSSLAFKSRFASDVVYSGTAYACGFSGTNENRIYALNEETGDSEWVFNGNAMHQVNVVHGMTLDKASDTLIFTTDRTDPAQHSLWAIDVINGTKRWSANVGQVWGKPLMAGDRLYVANLAGEIIAVDKNTGAILWTLPSTIATAFATNAAITVTPDDRVLIAVTDFFGNLLLATDDGNIGNWLWSVDANYATGTPIFGLADRNIYVGTSDVTAGSVGGLIKQYDITTGTLIASRDALSTATGAVTNIKIADTDRHGTKPILYASTDEGTVTNYCLPFRTSTPGVDTDSDTIEDGIDNCPNIANTGQEDLDQDGLGDVCDPQNYSDTFTYSIGGSVTGLVASQSIVLQNNNGDDLTITENGEFTFATRLLIHNDVMGYDITISTQPDDPDYICAVVSQGGTTEQEALNQAITGVTIDCSTTGDLIWKNNFE